MATAAAPAFGDETAPKAAGSAQAQAQAQAGFTGSDLLLSVAALSAAEAWAVGDYFVAGTGKQPPLIEHWTRGRWRLVRSPAVGGPSGGYLHSVAVLSPKNAWAVGGAGNAALIEHWNGKTWHVVPAGPARVKNTGTTLTGVTASSAKSVWAVGSVTTSRGLVPLIEHWNGTRWRAVRCPDPGGPSANDYLTAVTASKAGVWAAGTSAPGNVYRTVVLALIHGRWRLQKSPNPSGLGNWLGAVSAVGPRVLAAGFGGYDNPAVAQTLVMHRSGSVFRLDKTPARGVGAQDELYGVAATSSGGWAVGRGTTQTLTLRQAAGRWRRVPSPSWPSPATSILEGVTVKGDATWAVGQYSVDKTTTTGLISVSYSLILRWTGVKWIQVPSPNR
ncbi:MAG TPA: hypothetical protein VFI65_14625 [Streptosporangiaceae bacterium]|nr:hypothetical protein [Streptosporangiaceae bacterium]